MTMSHCDGPFGYPKAAKTSGWSTNNFALDPQPHLPPPPTPAEASSIVFL